MSISKNDKTQQYQLTSSIDSHGDDRPFPVATDNYYLKTKTDQTDGRSLISNTC